MKKSVLNIFGIILLAFFTSFGFAQERTDAKNQDKELGKVSWYRDYDDAVTMSLKQGKPILILFQEVPGCSTCRNYGKDVLSHPLMVEAIENLFIPLAIHNNKGGKDKETLEKFNEPSWNNPVVRIIDPLGKDIVKRVGRDYTALGLYSAITYALKAKNQEIPEYLNLLGDELTALGNNTVKEKYFKMYCFWTGEKQLGSKNGVLDTEAGFMGGHEVVKVQYDENEITNAQLTKFAGLHDFTSISEDHSYRPATNDEDYFLRHTDYKYLPLTPLQRTKINSALGNRKSGEKYLSPKQQKWLAQIKNKKNKGKVLYDKPFVASWASN